MKLKCLPEDFQVTELTERQPHGRGPFALYRLTKQSLGTPEAIDAALHRWNASIKSVTRPDFVAPSMVSMSQPSA